MTSVCQVKSNLILSKLHLHTNLQPCIKNKTPVVHLKTKEAKQ